ncbi:MAG: branched-chain amino acid transaminase [Chloroflexota bacterium]|nr:branched-chain amino acid transaminase [Chloroflexota bacterium]
MADHPQFIWVDGKLTPWNEATVHISQMGTATVSLVFEGIRAYWNETARKLFVFRLDAHLERFAQSMRLMRMKQPISNADLHQGVTDLIRANKYAADTYIRPFAFVESTTFGGVPGEQARIVLSTMDWASRLKSGKVSHACVSSWTRITDNVMPPRVKASSNYLNSRLASEEAKRNGYDAALILNPNGKVAEAPGACLMIVRDGKVITPSVTSGILESVTRATLIQLCREVLKIEVIEREVDRTELYVASEAFLCGTGAEITPLASIDRFTLGNGSIGPITQRVENLYHDLVRGIDTRHAEWRTEV